MQRFKLILEYLRAARDQQAFLVPTNLEARELASLAAEAQYYGLVALQESLQAAADVTKPDAIYDYKHEMCHYSQWQDEELKLQKLYDKGWELMESNVAPYSNNGYLVIYVALRRMKA